MSLCLRQKLEAAERRVNDTISESNDSNILPPQQIIIGLCRPLSKQLYAPNHHSHDASLDAHMVLPLNVVIVIKRDNYKLFSHQSSV